MDYDVVSVPPMSLPALDALQSLSMDFTSALDTLQRQNIVDAFARVDFPTKVVPAYMPHFLAGPHQGM